MKNFLKPILLATVALAYSMGCIAEVEDDDPDFRFAAQKAGECEVYYFVVDGATERAALTACGELCDDIICPDWENDAVASIPGPAGDDDTWMCDCTCPCDEEEAEPVAFEGAQQL